MSGLLGKKIGMTSIYDEAGKMVPVTVIEAGPCVVTQVLLFPRASDLQSLKELLSFSLTMQRYGLL